jgi:arylsulfatase A-like enzyme
VVDVKDYNDWIIGDLTVDFIRKQPSTKPFMLVSSFPGVKAPLDAMGKYETMYDPARVHLAPNVRPLTRGDNTYSMDQIRRMKANYLGKMTLVDDCIGRIVTALKERGTWDNTVVIFTSDHGEMMGSQGALAKSVFWEESARIPMLVRMPGRVGAGQRSDALVQFTDVYATVMDAIGAESSSTLLTRSLIPFMHGEGEARDAAFSEISHGENLSYMVRGERYKWFVQRGSEALFDLENDPYEMQNLIQENRHRSTVDEIKDRLLTFLMVSHVNPAANYKPLIQRTREAMGK